MKTAKILYLILLILMVSAVSLKAQVGIGTLNPDPSAELEVYSTTKGFLPPVMTSVQRNALISPTAEGLMVYCSDCSPVGYYLYRNSTWVSLMNTDNQTISRDGLTVTLLNGGSFADSVLTETEVDAFVANNGYLTSITEADGSNTNEIQTLSKNGTTISLSHSGGSFTDDVLTEAEVDAFAANNGYLTNTIDTDGSLSANSDIIIPSQKSVKAYADNNAGIVTLPNSLGDNYHFNLENMAELSVGSSSGSFNNLSLGYNNHSILIGGDNTVSIGHESLLDGSDNTIIGDSIFTYNGTVYPKKNVALGFAAGKNENQSYNVFLGSKVGGNNSKTGSVLLGYGAAYNSTSKYSVFIGYESSYQELVNYSLSIENSASTTPLIAGNFSKNRVGINTPIANLNSGVTLQVGGSISLGSGGGVIGGFSSDATLQSSSDTLVPTQKAVKDYLDDIMSDYIYVAGYNTSLGLNTGDNVIPTHSVVTDYVEEVLGTGFLKTFGSTSMHFNHNNMLDISWDVDYNLAIGDLALEDLTDGEYNIGIGYSSLQSITNGLDNLAIGDSALVDLTNGDMNVAIGYKAGRSITNNNSNVMIGSFAGRYTTGQRNVFMGTSAGASSGSNNSVFIGYQAGKSEDGDDRLFISNEDYSDPLISGSFSSRVVTICEDISGFDFDVYGANKDYNLIVSGGAYKSTSGSSGWNHHSDKRLKTNIKYLPAEKTLDKVLQMKSVSFEWNDTLTGLERDKGVRHGFIAQDLQQVWPEKISTGPYGYLITSYGTYDPMFVASIKALNTKLIELRTEKEKIKMEAQTKAQKKDQQIKKLNKRLEELKAMFQQTQTQNIQASLPNK